MKKVFPALLVALLAATSVYFAIKEFPVRYMTINEAVKLNSRAQIAGTVSAITKTDTSISFILTDTESRQAQVQYDGTNQPPLKEGMIASIFCRYDEKHDFFRAEKIYTKCPSKYQDKYNRKK